MRGAFITSKIENAATVGSLWQAFHHCSAGQEQGIAEFINIAISHDDQILVGFSAQGMLPVLYQRAVDYVIDSNLGFVNSYREERGTWKDVTANGEFSGGRGKVSNAIRGNFGRTFGAAVWDGGPELTDLARYLAGWKPEIWAIMDQRFKPLGTAYNQAHPGDDASTDVKNDFLLRLGRESANITDPQAFAKSFAKATITSEALLSYLSNPDIALNQVLAKKLIQDSNCTLSGENLDVAQTAERGALTNRIRGGEEVRFTREQLKTIIFDGLKKYGFIRNNP